MTGIMSLLSGMNLKFKARIELFYTSVEKILLVTR